MEKETSNLTEENNEMELHQKVNFFDQRYWGSIEKKVELNLQLISSYSISVHNGGTSVLP
jgi:hypothetical protein